LFLRYLGINIHLITLLIYKFIQVNYLGDEMKTIVKNSFLMFTLLTLFVGFAYADLFITELADPDNNASARYVEIFNNGETPVDLSTGYSLQRWTNDSVTPQDSVPLTGTIAAGDFYVVCASQATFTSVYGFAADQDIGTGGPADSNGDDQIALKFNDTVVDMFGVVGEDGSGTAHEFEDGRAERVASVTTGNTTWTALEWNIDNDSGGGDGAQNAPGGFDPAAWIGAASTDPEPSNHVASFAATATHESITLTWSDNDGAQAASEYLIKASTTSLVAITDPSDSAEVSNDTDLSDGSGAINVLHGTETYEWTGLTAETTYYFKIYPYTNTGSNTNYKTDGTVPTVTQATSAAPVTTTPSVGTVYISEVCDDDAGDYSTAFMEIYNDGDTLIDMENTYIERWSSGGTYDNYTYTFGAGVTIPAKGFLIVTRGAVESTFEAAWSITLDASCDYDAGHTNLYFTTGRSYKLYTSGAVLLDQTPVVSSGNRIVQTSIGVWSAEESSSNGTPAALDAEQVLPITLASFTAKVANGAVELAWETASETDNARFVIYRNDKAIASVKGAGTSSKTNNYTYVDNDIIPGTAYTYVLADVDYANVETKYEDKAVTVQVNSNVMETDFTVGAAYPNPFNPATVVPFELSRESFVKISLYNMLGQQVKDLGETYYSAGMHEVYINASGLTTGIYFIQFEIGNLIDLQKISLIK
jgi:hypothetical protein